jgi:hypothetical protein
LYQNGFTGNIPPEIGNLTELRELYLGVNELTGNIPDEIGDLSDTLQKLYLVSNQLTGTIPSALGNLTNLLELDVSYNQLFGSIPSTFDALQALVTFDVTGNCLVDFAPVQSPLNDVPNLIGATEDCECISDDTRVTTCGLGACEGNTGEETCVAGFWDGGTDTCDPFAGATAETCDNADNDCDGSTDEDLTRPTTCGVGACAGNAGIETCAAGAWGGDTCDPFEGAVADDTCNGLDENCDGTSDDGYVATATSCGVGECAGNAGLLTCVSGTPTDTCDPFEGAVADDTCNGLDENCDGTPDDEYVTTPTLCGVGACSAIGQIECQSGIPLNTCTPKTPSEEICDDNIDQDCDGDDLICPDSDDDWFVIPLPDNKGAVIFNL